MSRHSRFEPRDVDVTRLDGDGCGYSGDGHAAVFGALPGEKVSAAPLARKRKRHYFRTESVIEASPLRVEPVCQAASRCGGCSFQHLAHAEQLTFKLDLLKDLLSDTPPRMWLEPLSDKPFGYRSKARMGVKHVMKKDRVLVGFREKMKPYIAETSRCPILQPPCDDFPDTLAELISSLSVFDAIPQVELAAGDSETALVFRHLKPMTSADEDSLRQFGQALSLQIFLQPGGLDSIWRLYPDADAEDAPPLDAGLAYTLPEYDLRFRFSPQDFTQVNLAMNRKMVALALSLLEPDTSDRVLDAFCGIGNFSLALARSAGHVSGMELAAASIERAKANAAENGIRNVDFSVVDLHADIAESPGFKGFNKVLLDPPRSGAEQLVKRVASMDIERVVYVSCNPETLARDIKILVSAGFELQSAGIIDMFPHTTHVESIALLNRSSEPLRSVHQEPVHNKEGFGHQA